MEYRRVAKEFRHYALALEALLLLSLVAFGAYRFMHIFASKAPPVESSVQAWQSFGKWAVCHEEYAPRAGVGFFDTVDGTEARLAPEQMAPKLNHARSVEAASSRISTQTVELTGQQLHCSVVDMGNLPDVVVPPARWAICGEDARIGWHSQLFVMSGGSWNVVRQVWPQFFEVRSLTSYVRGYDFGYTSREDRYFTTISRGSTQSHADPSQVCRWQGGTSPEPSTTAAFVLVIDYDIAVTIEQDMLPQLFSLLSSLGGYMSLVILIFRCAFVQRYPESDIAQTFQERTLLGHHERGNPETLPSARCTQSNGGRRKGKMWSPGCAA